MNRELWVVDIEGNSLHPTTIWCLSCQRVGAKAIHTTTTHEGMKKLLLREDVVVIGHNFIRFDAVVLERILGIKIKALIIDTLAIAWVLDEKRPRVGLGSYGEDAGIPKVVVEEEQWSGYGMTKEAHAKLMKERCEDDVRINMWLWEKQWAELMELYEGDEEAVWRYLHYLMFKMRMAQLQEESGWKLDVKLCTEGLVDLEAQKGVKVLELAQSMPQVKKYKAQEYPAKPYKMDGSPSAIGLRWNALCEAEGKPEGYRGSITFLHREVDPNPGSHAQIKAWLFDLGWRPANYKVVRDKETGDTRQIEQVASAHIKGEVCDSVKELFGKEPSLEALNGLSILSHRISILKGFLKSMDEDGFVRARINGFTSTLRVKHSEVVNLPGIDKAYGELIRGVLIAPEGMELCGSDMTSQEDRIKQHFMTPHDPEYVKEMSADDYDPHLSLAVSAGAITEKQMQAHKDGVEDHSAVRKVFKATNYASQYSAGGATVARTAGVPTHEGEALVNAYWEKNWSIRAIAKEQEVKECLGQMWLRNPINKFWYSLRNDKDRFSVLCQGSGAYAFDLWMKYVLEKRPQITGSFHDECILTIKEGHQNGCTKLLKGAIKAVNDELQLNRSLDIDTKYGYNYSQIH